MSIEPDAARDSLREIDSMMAQARKAVASGAASPILIVWGVIGIVCFAATHFFARYAGWVWLVGDVVGVLATLALVYVWRSPVKPAPGLNRRLTLFWASLFGYIFVWLVIVAPVNGLQLGAFITSAVMFAYIVLGLWLEAPFLIYLGLAVTSLTVACYLLLPSVFNLCMAAGGGGALLGTGLYIRMRWR